MSDKSVVNGRTLRREAVEEQLAPGESVKVVKAGGKIFELRRVDAGPRDINTALDRLLAEMPPEGKRVQINLSKLIIEDRE